MQVKEESLQNRSRCISRCSERTPDVLASSASEILGKTRNESQLPLSSWNEQHQRTGRLVKDAYSSSYSESNAFKSWSSQEWKSDELMEARTGRDANEQPPGLFVEHTDRFVIDDDDMDSDTVAESDLSSMSRSFLHRVNDRVRKIRDGSSKDATPDINKHSWQMENFHVFYIASSCIHGEGLPRNFTFHQKYREQSHFETDLRHIWRVDSRTIRKTLHGSIYLWLVMKKSSVSRTRSFTYFQILCYALGRWARTWSQTLHGKTVWSGSKVHHNTELWTQLTESRWNASGRFPRVHHVAALWWSHRSTEQIRRSTRNTSQEEFYCCRCSTTYLVTRKTMKENAWQMLKSSLYMQRSLVLDTGHLLVQVPKRSGILWKRIVHKEFGIISRKRCCWNLPKAHVKIFVLRHHCPEVNSESKNLVNCRFTLLPLRHPHNCFCKSAQSLRSSREHVWRIWIPSR